MQRILHPYSMQPNVRRLALAAALGAALALTACESTGPKVDTSAFPVPGVYRNAPATVEPDAGHSGPRAQWWTQYGSQELDRLVDRALANNADLRIATLQVAQAKIRADQSRAGNLPSVNAPIRAVGQAQGNTIDSQQYSQAAIASAFRLDVWGEQRALVDSADMQLARAVHERENVQRNVIGNLVLSYIAYLSISDSILVAKENEAVASEMLRAVEKRLALGDATLDELEQQRAVVFSQHVLIPGLENQQEDLRHALSRLVGSLPGHLVLSENGLDALQLPTVQTGLPSALLLGRPDIRMMEARMRAANANIEVARARMLPPVDLSAQMGYSGASLASLIQPQNMLITAAAALAINIFDGGQRKGEKAFAQSYYEEMVETYGKTVLQAVRDVESALANLRTASRRLEAQKGISRAALKLFKQGSDAFAVGALDQVSLLEHRKNYQRSADEIQRMKSELLRGYATLAYSLGLGAVLTEGPAAPSTKEAALETLQRDVRVGGGNGAAVLMDDAVASPELEGTWVVELPGVFHRSGLLPLWRDLQARVAVKDETPWIKATHLGHVERPGETPEAWYRVSVAGFKGREASKAFCDTLLQAGQSCKVVAGNTSESASSRLAYRK